MAIEVHQKCYDYLTTIEDQLDLEIESDTDEFTIVIEVYRDLSRSASALKETYNNLLISYYAFKEIAKKNKKVGKEFKKLPSDFTPLREHLEELIAGYDNCLENLKQFI